MLSRIESGAKAFIVTTEVPVKIRQNKHTNQKKKKETNFSKRKLRKNHWVVIICPLIIFSLIHSVNDYLLSIVHKPSPMKGVGDIATNKIEKISVFLLVIN